MPKIAASRPPSCTEAFKAIDISLHKNLSSNWVWFTPKENLMQVSWGHLELYQIVVVLSVLNLEQRMPWNLTMAIMNFLSLPTKTRFGWQKCTRNITHEYSELLQNPGENYGSYILGDLQHLWGTFAKLIVCKVSTVENGSSTPVLLKDCSSISHYFYRFVWTNHHQRHSENANTQESMGVNIQLHSHQSIYLDLTDDYGTDAILQTIRIFVTTHGCSSEI